MKRNIIIIFVIFIIVIIGVAYLWRDQTKPIAITDFTSCAEAGYPIMESYPRQCLTPDGKNFTENINGQNLNLEPIVSEPIKNVPITSPLAVKGEARGTWFFEAAFPIKVTDANGKILGQGQAEAASDWMTSQYVPFTAQINFSTSSTKTGFLVLEKDNPSGLPANSGQIKIPLIFKVINTSAENKNTNLATTSANQP